MNLKDILNKAQSLKIAFEKHLDQGIYTEKIENIVRNLTMEDYTKMAIAELSKHDN